MSELREKMAKLGLFFPETTPPLGAYVPALRTDRYIITSGQLPMEKGELKFQGTVGTDLDVEEGYEAAKLCVLNCLSAVNSIVGNLEKVEKIIRLTGYIACREDFTEHSKVMNGASDLLVALFGEDGRHTRSVVGVRNLPLGAPVEVELTATLRK